jgi:hypothetical protein
MMSYITTRKLVMGKNSYVNKMWDFEYVEMPKVFDSVQVCDYVGANQEYAVKVAKRWDSKWNTIWLIRHYLAVKMLLSASVMLTSARYADKKNIKITDSYLKYYSVLSCLRACLFTDVKTDWKDGEIIKATHKKIINSACSILRSLSTDFAEKVRELSFKLKDIREIYSYGAPSSGPSLIDGLGIISMDEIIDICRLLAEIAQMQSEILEISVDKHSHGDFELLDELAYLSFDFKLGEHSVYDEQDMIRFVYFYGKFPRPTNLLCMVSEGHVDDYFGAWSSEEEDNHDMYDPDDDHGIIFPF